MPNAISQVRREIKHTGSMKAKIAILLYRSATLYRSRNPFTSCSAFHSLFSIN